MTNVKSFRLFVNETTAFNTNMFLCPVEGGDMIRCEATVSLQSFGGSSAFDSDPIQVKVVSDSDTSGSPVGDPGGDMDMALNQYLIPGGWPRPVPGIEGAPAFSIQDDPTPVEDRVPSRGRNLFLRLQEPATLPDPNAEYVIAIELTITKL